MQLFTVLSIFAYSILLAAAIGLVRYPKVLEEYRVFIMLCVIASIVEIISGVSVMLGYNTLSVIVANLYVLLEFLLLATFYFRLKLFHSEYWVYYGLYTVLPLIWVIDNFYVNSITTTNSFFRVCYAIVVVCMSINQMNSTLLEERGSLTKSALFVISVTSVFYFSFKAIYECFYLFKLSLSTELFTNIFIILCTANLIANLLFAYAVLCIPTRRRFTLRYL
jgi:hypothetical protein